MVDFLSIVGLIAACASAIAFLPQVIKTFRTKRAEDVSFYMIVVFMIASVSWLTYGLERSDFFIVSTNFIVLVLTITLAIMKVIYKK